MTRRIIAPHFIAAVILNEKNIVWETASMLRYMQGWTLSGVDHHGRDNAWSARRHDARS